MPYRIQSIGNNSYSNYKFNFKYKNNLYNERNKNALYENFDYSKNDGKISLKDKLINLSKGAISPFVSMFSSPKNFIKGAIATSAVLFLTIATSGAILPLFAILGAVKIGINAHKAAKAQTDDEAKQAWKALGAAAGLTGILATAASQNKNKKEDAADIQEIKQDTFEESPKNDISIPKEPKKTSIDLKDRVEAKQKSKVTKESASQIQDEKYIDNPENIEYLRAKIQEHYLNKGYDEEEAEIATDNMFDLIMGERVANYTNDSVIEKIKQIGIPENEEFAIGHISANTYNQTLLRDENSIEADLLDIIMENLAPIEEDITVYRGIGARHLFDEDYTFVKNLKRKDEGEIIEDRNYSYSCSDKGIMKMLIEEDDSDYDDILLTIKVPKGAKVSHTIYSKQDEYLLPRNSKYRIVSPYSAKTNEIILEYILPENKAI